MVDEAARFGVKVQPHLLSQRLGMPVLPISAKYGAGYPNAIAAITDTLQQQNQSVQVDNLTEQLVSDQLAKDIHEALDDAVEIPPILSDRLTHLYVYCNVSC